MLLFGLLGSLVFLIFFQTVCWYRFYLHKLGLLYFLRWSESKASEADGSRLESSDKTGDLLNDG